MRSIVSAIVVLLTVSVLLGMGNLGGAPEGAVPNVDENIKARLVDRSGVTIDLTRFSMGGKVFLEGRHGDGKMSVFFRDMAELSFAQVNGDSVQADLLLKSGNRLLLKVRKGEVFHGAAGSAAYRISAQDVSRIAFPK